MHYEVEQKFRRDLDDNLVARLEALGAERGATLQQVDVYYAHPSRDFAQTDEALRIRRVDGQNVVTYKGPKIDSTTKTRQEIELAVADGDQCDQLLQAVGFRPVAEIAKVRQIYCLTCDEFAVEVALDEIEGVGSFVELEIVVDDESQLDAARRRLADLANRLQLSNIERRSYLELCMGR